MSSLPSWDEFAAWYRRLAQGSDVIDDSVRTMGKKLAEGAKTRMEKIQRDFEFVSALRYVAIEMGVQGFRPRTPAQVLANRYGDCKDKANLVSALLRSQGIDAHFVLLNRFAYTNVNFPSWQFNHAIAFVPAAAKEGQPNDLWLDTTDSVTPFGSVPPGDYGRAGLVFSDDKAEFKTVKTDQSSTSEIHDDWTLRQDANGTWSGEVKRVGTGFAEDALRREYRGLAPVQRQVQLFQAFNALWPLAEFSQVQVSDASVQGQPMRLQAEVTGDIANLPRVGEGVVGALAAPTRNRPMLLNDGQPMRFTQTITLHYDHEAPKDLPAAFHTEVAGEQLSVEWEHVDEHTFRRTARLNLAQGLVATADYTALRRALRDWGTALAR
ncbi:MAG: transglutaminase-like domain-containing protein [Chthoniobacteraceae bacterium]